ncbi:hypothetical protein H6P81_019538 [Aristolochia fimbriata]|uniref:Uncharacterized protein n=1 Tax=Aristolochia fimbriata TaxID=158543 RepID=A0AAV7DS43_ARIFI|nr:hypothetical protein H6P81_019538 [Aristolochia fimbriata]
MARMQLLGCHQASPPRLPYSAVAPPLFVSITRRRARITLDTISEEEDSLDQLMEDQPSSSTPCSSSSSSSSSCHAAPKLHVENGEKVIQFLPFKSFLFESPCCLKIGKFSPATIPKLPHILLEERFFSLLQSCSSLGPLRQIHGQIVVHGLDESRYLAPKIVAAAARSKRMEYAHQYLSRIAEPNVFLWNAMLKGYVENECYRETIIMFSLMKQRGAEVNEFTFPFVLKSCAKLTAIKEGKEVHGFVTKSGFQENEYVGTTLIELYSAGGDMESAYDVFNEMPARNVVVWTAMVAAYILSGDVESARCVFNRAPERDVILFNTMISGYIDVGDTASARELFDQLQNRDVMSWNTMLTAYANNGQFEASERLLEEMPQRNIFSWNGLIGGCARQGRFFQVLAVFKRMLMESEVQPNDTTLVMVLSSCARLGALDLGMWVQVYAESVGLKDNVYINNCLIDMYAKCGSIESSISVFNNMHCRDLITWNAIINGLAMHGRGTEALDIFNQMRCSGEKPDGITFVGVLCACTHAGLVKDGFTYFRLMSDHYMIVPQIEHYGCMVDLLGKAGLLSEAMNFVNKMPIEPDSVIWSALLGACRVHKHVNLAEFALKRLIQLEPENMANYVVLSNMYGALGRWEDKAKLKLVTREVGVRKLPGCSFIEVNYAVTEFYSLDTRHHKSDEIYDALRGLTENLKLVGSVTELEQLVDTG